MKKTFILFLSILSFSIQAQMKDLAELATGEFVTFQPIFDHDDKLFGYFTLFNQGEIDDKTIKEMNNHIDFGLLFIKW